MRKLLIALACIGAVLLIAGSLALSHERAGAATIEPLSEQAGERAAESSTEGPAEASPETMEPAASSYEGFDVEVLVDGRPLEEYYARGRSYVEALEGAEYELRIRNPLPVRVAVALSVDGLNTIDARRTSAWDASKWVIEPYGTIYITGWQMSGVRARRFYFTSERDSYGAKLGQTANLGNISAVFFRERAQYPVRVTPPRPSGKDVEEERRSESRGRESSGDAPQANSSASGSAADRASKTQVAPSPRDDDEYAATGIGRSVRHDVTWVNLELERRPAAEVSIRYEYHDALVRLGIIPRPPYTRPDPLLRRERSTGFDGHRYSPEP